MLSIVSEMPSILHPTTKTDLLPQLPDPTVIQR